MALLKIITVFFALVATCLSCKLSSECDQQCTDLEAYILSNRSTLNTRYRLQYHVSPPIGWMNDPNGFIYYESKYHIFYQYYPYGAVHGDMFWGHSTSPDLVNWETLLTALIPGEEQIFSGSAFVLGTTLGLIYTGHVGNDTVHDQSQYLAFSDDGEIFHKYASNPVLRRSDAITPDFRDPKIWKNGDYWYVVIGSKTADKRGEVLLYRTADLLNWQYLSVIAEANNATEYAFMMECPDFFELDGKYVLMTSPQGMNASGDRYQNLYQTGYMLGSFSYETFQFTVETEFQELDFGHDFYATQSTEKDGKRLLIGWFGMWNSTEYAPEVADGWAGALTIFRELSLSGTRILMTPVAAMETLRNGTAKEGTFTTSETVVLSQTGELIVSADWTVGVSLLLTGNTGGSNVTLEWDLENKKVVVDRDGEVRQVEWTPGTSASWRIFLDTSSVELFCGDGEVVFSSRAYPEGGWLVENKSTQNLTATIYNLNRSVPL
ncbi:sucrose-6-phosphate hydrolase-like [Anticarsia gemmatalis]|uniref:sucrose-6-phosphate hydrolase-like n=1 Tax=Anticarsia gemmatalis TaxID=129554 RepID=UPI003F76CD05